MGKQIYCGSYSIAEIWVSGHYTDRHREEGVYREGSVGWAQQRGVAGPGLGSGQSPPAAAVWQGGQQTVQGADNTRHL